MQIITRAKTPDNDMQVGSLVREGYPHQAGSAPSMPPDLSTELTGIYIHRCASGCVVECRICNREVVGSNLGLGYFAPRSTQPSIPPGSVNEYQLGLAVWCSGNALVSINAVALHRARLVLGWVTAFGQVNCLIT